MVKKKTGIAKKLNAVPKRVSGSVWLGPAIMGVTQSILCTYLACKERCRLRVIDGLSAISGFRHAIEYGNLWHVCEEHLNGDWRSVLKSTAKKMIKKYPLSQDEIEKWYNVCIVQFEVYLERYHKVNKTQKLVLSEQNFEIDFKLPTGRTAKLRGKWDGVLLEKGKYRLKENKSKGNPREALIERQLGFDIQTMIYIIALEEAVSTGKYGLTKKPLNGVMYNVIKRPLSGGVGTIRPHKATKTKPAETLPAYYARLKVAIEENLDQFFMRWDVLINKRDTEKFKRTFLIPVLENLLDDYEWWDYAKRTDNDPFDFMKRCELFPNHHERHFRYPFGVYNALSDGGMSEYDDLLQTGSMIGLQMDPQLFPELEEESEDDIQD